MADAPSEEYIDWLSGVSVTLDQFFIDNKVKVSDVRNVATSLLVRSLLYMSKNDPKVALGKLNKYLADGGDLVFATMAESISQQHGDPVEEADPPEVPWIH